MDQTIIAVSKWCCPVCWELLDILRNKCKRFHVRGQHATLFPIELPSWLSEDCMDEMISRFKQIVRDELVDMMASVMYVRTPSRQNIANSTTGSRVDDDDEGVPGAGSFEAETIDNLYDLYKANDNQATTPFMPADSSSSTSEPTPSPAP